MAIKLKNILFFLLLVFVVFVTWLFFSKDNYAPQKEYKRYDGYPSQPECLKVAEAAIAKHGKGYPESGVTGNRSSEFWVGKYRFDTSTEPRFFVAVAEGQYYIGTNGVRAPFPGQDVLTRIPINLLIQRYSEQFNSLPTKGTYLQIGFRCDLGKKINPKWVEQSAVGKEQEQRSKYFIPSLKEVGIDNGLRIFISGIDEPYAKHQKYYYPLSNERQYDGRLLSFQCDYDDICDGNFYLADDLKITFAFPYENLSDWQAIYNFVLDYTKRNISSDID